jgi:hypothetical protein
MAAKSEELKALEEIAGQVAQLIQGYRSRFGHDPVICVEHVEGLKATPDCTEVWVIGGAKESDRVKL